MPNYGHTSNGVNLANYRLLTQSNERKAPHYRSTADWSLETKEHVGISHGEAKQSSTLRATGNMLQVAAADLVINDLSTVESALRNKISQTEQLKQQLERALSDIESEMMACLVIRGQLEERLAKVQAKAQLNAGRLQVRDSRPNRERTMDDVERNLLAQSQLMTSFADKVKRAIAHVDREVQQLEGVKAKVVADLQDKVEAIEVDTAVMGVGPHGELTMSPTSARRGDHALKTPHTWIRSTEENLANARHWLTDAARLRKAIRHALHNARNVEHDLSTNLNTAMMTKLAHTRHLKDSVEAQLARVQDETVKAQAMRNKLVAALEAKKGPLAQAKERWALRKSRPSRETVQDEVEAALCREVAHLNAVTSQLSTQINNVDKEIDALHLASAMLQDNLQDKESALTLDERCAMLDGRINSSTPPPSSVVSGSSNLSTAHTATLRRIADLEQELMTARREREALESSVRNLKGTFARPGSPSKY